MRDLLRIGFKNQKIQFVFFIFLTFSGPLIFLLSNPNVFSSEGFSFFAWFMYFPPLFLSKNTTRNKSIIFGIIYGFFSYFLYGFWLFKYSFPLFFATCFLYALELGFVFFLLNFCAKNFLHFSNFFCFLILLSYEILKSRGFLGFSYGISGYSQWKNDFLIQIADIFGVYGISSLIIIFSCLIDSILEKIFLRNLNQNLKINDFFIEIIVFVIFVILILCSICYGKFRINHFEKLDKNASKIKIALIQNNEDPWKNGINESYKNIQNLVFLSEEAKSKNPEIEIVVWPETAVVPSIIENYYFPKDFRRELLIKNLLEYINDSDFVLVTGNFNRKREEKTINDYNSVFVFKPKINVIPPEPEEYSKIHLVPFSEKFPFVNNFPKFEEFLKNHDFHLWSEGKEVTVFNVKNLYFGTSVCFEDTFPEISAKMIKKGARCLVTLANDAWSKSKVCQMQHLSMAVFRSVENRVPCVRSSTSGETCMINANGKVVQNAPAFCESYVVANVPVYKKNYKFTFYNKYGRIIENSVIFATFAILLMKIINVIILKKNGKQRQNHDS